MRDTHHRPAAPGRPSAAPADPLATGRTSGCESPLPDPCPAPAALAAGGAPSHRGRRAAGDDEGLPARLLVLRRQLGLLRPRHQPRTRLPQPVRLLLRHPAAADDAPAATGDHPPAAAPGRPGHPDRRLRLPPAPGSVPPGLPAGGGPGRARRPHHRARALRPLRHPLHHADGHRPARPDRQGSAGITDLCRLGVGAGRGRADPHRRPAAASPAGHVHRHPDDGRPVRPRCSLG